MNKLWGILIPILLTVMAILAAGYIITFKPFSSHTTITHFSDSSDGSLADYYQTSQQLAGQNQTASSSISFLAVGDIMLSRNVAESIQQSGNVDFPFKQISTILKSTNFNFANLEGPAAPSPTDNIIGGNSMVFGDPPQNLTALKDFNFQIINLANNHAFDQGLAGIDTTIKTLDGLSIAHEGTGDNLNTAWAPAVVTANGIKICFVGAAYGTNSGGSIASQFVAEIADVTRLKTAITTAKTECDFVVATMHAGIEYTRTPNQQQITFAHTAIDDGADIVIGAHPHWVQPIEKYKGKYIFYSLGNFIFDQDFSQDTMEGLTLKINLSKSSTANPLAPGAASLDDLQGSRTGAQLDSIELLPVIIQSSQVRPATADEAKKILQNIGETENILK